MSTLGTKICTDRTQEYLSQLLLGGAPIAATRDLDLAARFAAEAVPRGARCARGIMGIVVVLASFSATIFSILLCEERDLIGGAQVGGVGTRRRPWLLDGLAEENEELLGCLGIDTECQEELLGWLGRLLSVSDADCQEELIGWLGVFHADLLLCSLDVFHM